MHAFASAHRADDIDIRELNQSVKLSDGHALGVTPDAPGPALDRLLLDGKIRDWIDRKKEELERAGSVIKEDDIDDLVRCCRV